MKKIVIIGAGISGLALGCTLKSKVKTMILQFMKKITLLI